MGLVIILALGLYFAIAMGVIAWAVSYAKKNGKSTMRWGWGAALAMYLLVFWDWLPTVVAHKYYCATEAGFWVYKTPEQWKKENPKMRDYVAYEETSSNDFEQEKINDGNKTTFTVNKRSKVKFTEVKTSIFPLITNRKIEETLLDPNQNIYLTKKITFQAGHPFGAPKKLSHLKFWINIEGCKGSNGNVASNTWGDTVKEFMRLARRLG
jgi:hypothetical protein